MSQRNLTPVSQLVIRNWESFNAYKVLVIAPPADDFYNTLTDMRYTGELFGFTVDYADYTTIQKQWVSQINGRVLFFDISFRGVDSCSSFDGVIFFLQKSNSLTDYLLDMVAVWMNRPCKLWFVGENGEGIRSWYKRLLTRFNYVEKLDAARHCQLFEATENTMTRDENFSLEKYIKKSLVPEGFEGIRISTLPGVFCHGFIDKGSMVLLRTLKKRKYGDILDFGCGSGLISVCIAQLDKKANFTLVDSNALALESARLTMSENNSNQCQFIGSDGLREVIGKYDLIISNPPFHRGTKTNYEIVENFLKEAKYFLKETGELRIVAHSFLHYTDIILNTFGNCKPIASQSGFTVYSAQAKKK